MTSKLVIKSLILTLFFLGAFLLSPASVQAANGSLCIAAQYKSPGMGAAVSLGQNYEVIVTMQNIGTTTWNVGSYHLGATDPNDDTFWGLSRAPNPGGVTTVPPGGTITYDFSVRPFSTGTHLANWKMVQEGVEWFGDRCMASVTIVATPGGVYPPSGDAASCTAGANLVPGSGCRGAGTDGSVYSTHIGVRAHELATNSTAPMIILFENSGRTDWSETTMHRLGLLGSYDWGWGGRKYLDSQPIKFSAEWAPLISSNIGQFSGNIRAPATPGTYAFNWRMVHELVAWFGPTINFNIRVFGQSFIYTPASLNVGDNFTALVTTDPSCSTSVNLGNVGGATCTPNGAACGQPQYNPPTDPNTCRFTYSCRANTAGGYTLTFDAATGGTSPSINPSCSVSGSGTINNVIPQPFSINNPSVACSGSSPYASVSWTPSTNATYYIVYRNDGVTSPQINAPTTSWTDWSIVTGTQYNYHVTAYNGFGNIDSGWSAWTAVTPVCNAPTIISVVTNAGFSCINGNQTGNSVITINWNNGGFPVSWVDISTVSSFASYYNKAVSGTSTTAPIGFNGSLGVSGALTIEPGRTYYVRAFNGLHSPTIFFSVPICPPTGLTASCPIPGNPATLTWNSLAPSMYYQLRVDKSPDSWNGSCVSPNLGDICDNSVATSPYSLISSAGSDYKWWLHACNAYACSTPTSGPNFTCNSTPPQPVITNNPGFECLINPQTGTDAVTISWTSGGIPVSWVDISTDALFTTYYHKAVSGISTTAPNGFNGFVGVSGPLTINPNTPYWVRLFNGVTVGPIANFTIPYCIDLTVSPPTTSPPSPVAGNNVQFSATIFNSPSQPVSLGYKVRFCVDSGTALNCASGIGSFYKNEVNIPSGVGYPYITFYPPLNPWPATVGAHTYYVCADVNNDIAESNKLNNCNEANVVITNFLPWLQTVGGDVNANKNLNLPHN